MSESIDGLLALALVLALLLWGEMRLNKFKKDHGLD